MGTSVDGEVPDDEGDESSVKPPKPTETVVPDEPVKKD